MCQAQYFFFSSRRRHTRFDCDWSSDVCSSDLARSSSRLRSRAATWASVSTRPPDSAILRSSAASRCLKRARSRSEERRVGKEWRCRASREHEKKKRGEGAEDGEVWWGCRCKWI